MEYEWEYLIRTGADTEKIKASVKAMLDYERQAGATQERREIIEALKQSIETKHGHSHAWFHNGMVAAIRLIEQRSQGEEKHALQGNQRSTLS